jgi:hypothetical protein
VEDVMRLELRYRSDIDLSLPAMQVEIRSHIARCLRDYPRDGEGVITLGGVEHCFVYVVQDDVVHTVIGPPRRQLRKRESHFIVRCKSSLLSGEKAQYLRITEGDPLATERRTATPQAKGLSRDRKNSEIFAAIAQPHRRRAI